MPLTGSSPLREICHLVLELYPTMGDLAVLLYTYKMFRTVITLFAIKRSPCYAQQVFLILTFCVVYSVFCGGRSVCGSLPLFVQSMLK